MSARVGGVIPIKEGRKEYLVQICPSFFAIGHDYEFGINFQSNEWSTQKQVFVKHLVNLSHLVAQKQRAAKDQIKSTIDTSKQVEILQNSLTLDENSCLNYLKELRTSGKLLRRKLSKKVVESFQNKGFLKGETEQEPAFTFMQVTNNPEDVPTPILWDMMHEIDNNETNVDRILDEKNWGRFWGLRIPITHWISNIESEVSREIQLRKTFAAVHEDLSFAYKESQLLVNYFKGKIHINLEDAFREIVYKSGWQDCQASFWLKKYLDDLANKKNEIDPDSWKESTLISILKDSQNYYDLLHFACHCEAANDKNDFLSVLNMKVAGAPVLLNISLLEDARFEQGSKLAQEARRKGRLVFLNACDSGNQDPVSEPPGFPTSWIISQKASAVIVTHCKIPDYFAYAFAEKFYENLDKGINPESESCHLSYVSEALLETRRYFMKEHNNPLGLAYVLYAIDGARILSDFIR